MSSLPCDTGRRVLGSLEREAVHDKSPAAYARGKGTHDSLPDSDAIGMIESTPAAEIDRNSNAGQASLRPGSSLSSCGVCPASRDDAVDPENCRTASRTALDVLLPLIVLGLGAVILFGHLGNQSIWIDEAHVFRYCRGTFADIVAKSRDGLVNTSPLPLLIARLTVDLTDASEFSLRLPSAVFGLLTVLTLYGVGHQLGGRLSGFLTALLALGSWGCMHYSRIFRHYSMTMFCTAALLWLTLRLRDRWSGRCAVLYAVVGTIGVLMAYEIAIVVLVTGAWLLVPKDRTLGWSRHTIRLALMAGPIVGAFAASYAAYAPSPERQARIADEFWSDTIWLGGSGAEFLDWSGGVWRLFLETGTAAYFKPLPVFVSGAAIVLGAVALLRSRHRGFVIPGLGVALVMFIAAALGKFPFAGERPTLPAAVALMPVVGFGLARLGSRPSGIFRRLTSIVLILGVCAPTLALTIDRTVGRSYVPEHLRPIAEHIRAEAVPGDLVYVYWMAVANMEYYNRNGEIPFVPGVGFSATDPEQMVRSAMEHWSARPGRLWLVIGRDWRRDTDRLIPLFDGIATRTFKMRRPDATLCAYARFPESDDYLVDGRLVMPPNRVCPIDPQHADIATATSRGSWSGIDIDLPDRTFPDRSDVMTFEYAVQGPNPAAVGVHVLLFDRRGEVCAWQPLPPGDGTVTNQTVSIVEMNKPDDTHGNPDVSGAVRVVLRLQSPGADEPASLHLTRFAWSHPPYSPDEAVAADSFQEAAGRPILQGRTP